MAGAMLTVKLEVMSWLTPIFETNQRSRLQWEQEIETGATVRDLFKQLTDRYPKLKGMIYDPGDGALTGLVSVIFNNRVLELAGGLDAEIQDGDSVVLLPAYAGGA
jgi:molybdopterin converting factor small subunit